MNKSLAVIPARGGSKRIPQKNIRPFLGKPIIAYSIEIALQSALFEEVMVSTEDEEIAAVAVRHGASVPFLRSKHNSDDFATIADVLAEVVDRYSGSGRQFDYVCCIYAASPLVTSDKLRRSFEVLAETHAQLVLPVVKFSFPIQRALRITEDGTLAFVWPQNMNKRSQDLESTYHDAGQFFWGTVDAISGKIPSSEMSRVPFILSELEAQDIDDESDWALAEMKFQRMRIEH